MHGSRKGVSHLGLTSEDRFPFPSPHLGSENCPECFRGLAGRLILGGSGQSWGRKRITLGPDSRRLTSLGLLPFKMF